MSTPPLPLRIGILGCASISRKNAIAISNSESACIIKAVASRSMEKAKAFVEEMFSSSQQEITCFGNYDDLIESDKVDALYIPLPTTLHKDWVLKALQVGHKHVVLEKPVALCLADYEEMIQIAQQNNKYLMDGTMFVHHPRTTQFVQSINAANDTSLSLGKITRIEGGFSFCADDAFFHNNIRAQVDGDPLGCLGDLGWYVIRIALLVLGPQAIMTSAQVVDYQLNTTTTATDGDGDGGAGGVPIDATCLVKFDNPQVILNFHVSFTSQFRQYVHVVGTKAWAHMDDWVLPKQHPIHYSIQSMNLTQYDLITEHSIQKYSFGGAAVQEVLMWKKFALLAKAVDAAYGSGWDGDSTECQEARQLSQVSVNNQRIVDALMKSIQGGGIKVEGTAVGFGA